MVDLMGKRNYFFVLSALILIAGIIGYFVNGGFQEDISFKGGTVLEFKMNDPNFSADRAKTVAEAALGNKKVSIQKSQSLSSKDNTKKTDIMMVSIANSSDALSGDEIKKVESAIINEFKLNPSDAIISENSVQPFIGDEIKGNGIKAIIVASILIIVYIWFRFRIMSGLSAGVMAVVALLHDVMIMLAVYAIFRIPLNESFIAAILTVYGYSMNDTIIIYDRIRENSNLLRKTAVAELVNKSIMQTLARSINTVVTVLISIITVYVFAIYFNIPSIKEFSFPLIIGIASGCYSSIFIASPLWVMWKEGQATRKISAKSAR